MNFRECRQAVMKELLSFVDPSFDSRKNFLFLGGMRSAAYLFNYDKVKLYGLCGCGEINTPGIFEILEIDYKVIMAKDLFKVYDKAYPASDNFFVIPAVREMLNTDVVNMDNYSLVGHSYFTINSIDDEKIYLNTYDENEKYYLDRKVYNRINNSRNWIMEADFEIYVIDKNKLRKNTKLVMALQTSEKELLQKNINTFLVNTKNIGKAGTIRYEGIQVYEIISNHILAAYKYLKKVKGSDKYAKFLTYIYLQLINFRKMIAAGSDAYYRSEFLEILSTYPEAADELNEWKALIALWRKFGRVLSRVASKQYLANYAEEGLLELVQVWSRISDKEIKLIMRLKALFE